MTTWSSSKLVTGASRYRPTNMIATPSPNMAAENTVSSANSLK